ncbi:uncharacterized protein [Medicago truncatula]|uniref:uncharacterized protein n=1 Tax=Medicago truncatula TaxID=3880 RepID=UPI000D2F160B|nr:uncharacterized protein LOC112417406 [Medicago truncatula]
MGVVKESVVDRWKWSLDPVKGYSIGDAYQMFTATDQNPNRANMYTICHKQLPLKVSLFVWCLFHNCLPTKDNLLRRGIVHPDATNCVGGFALPETADHLFITCSHFSQLWVLVRSWLGFSSVDTFRAFDHVVQFGQLGGFPRSSHHFLKLIWFSCVWTIWKERNN